MMDQYMLVGFSVWALHYGNQWVPGMDLIEDDILSSSFSWQEMCDIGYLKFDAVNNSYRITDKALNYLKEHSNGHRTDTAT